LKKVNARVQALALFPNPALLKIFQLNLTIDDENISNAKVKIINQLGQDVTSSRKS
jgi:hypothetical protein